MTTHPRLNSSISVIIPCYNQGHFLADAIDSVLNQTYPHVRPIVVDDGSTDQTPEVARRYGDRLLYLRKENAGLSAARNTGILAAQSDFVHFLDSDDYLPPDMLERHMAAADANPTVTVLHGGWQEVDVTGRILREIAAHSISDDPFHHLQRENRFPPCSVTVRRAAFANVGLFDVRLRSCEDWDMWLRLAAAGYEFVAVPGAIASYRRHGDSMSRNYERMWLTGLAALEKSRTYHTDCKKCREALACGLLMWRRECLGNELAAYRARGELRTGLTKAMLDIVRSPLLTRLLLAQIIVHARYAVWRGRSKLFAEELQAEELRAS